MIYIKSYLEQAEDLLLSLTTEVFNLSAQEASQLSIQQRELGRQVRLEAEALLEQWEGTPEQVSQVSELVWRKRLDILERR